MPGAQSVEGVIKTWPMFGQNNLISFYYFADLETGVEVHQPLPDLGDLGAEQDWDLVEVMERGEVSVGREDFELRHLH